MQTCAACGAVNPAEDRFCGACGARLTGPAAAAGTAVPSPPDSHRQMIFHPSPRSMLVYLVVLVAGLLFYEQFGIRAALKTSVEETIKPSLERVDPMGLYNSYQDNRCAARRGTQTLGRQTGESNPDLPKRAPGPCVEERNALDTLWLTIKDVSRAGWPFWLLDFVPVVLLLAAIVRAKAYQVLHPGLGFIVFPVALFARGLMSWVLQFVLTAIVLRGVIIGLQVLSFGALLYAAYATVRDAASHARSAHRLGEAASRFVDRR